MAACMFTFIYSEKLHGLVFVVRTLLSVVVAIGIDLHISSLVRFCFILLILLLLVYFVVRICALHFIYFQGNAWFSSGNHNLSIFFTDTYSKLEAKFILVKCFLIVIALTLLLCDLIFVKLNSIVFPVLVLIAVFLAVMVTICIDRFSHIDVYVALWSCCLLIYYFTINMNINVHFDFDFDLWLCRMPLIFLMLGSDLAIWGDHIDMRYRSRWECYCPPACYLSCFVLWICYECDNTGINLISYVMIPVWLLWVPLCYPVYLLKMHMDIDSTIKNVNEKYIQAGTINDTKSNKNLLLQLNQQLNIKRKNELFEEKETEIEIDNVKIDIGNSTSISVHNHKNKNSKINGKNYTPIVGSNNSFDYKNNKSQIKRKKTRVPKSVVIGASQYSFEQDNELHRFPIRYNHTGSGILIRKCEDDDETIESYYRLRSTNLIEEIVSPNHVCLNKDTYKQYLKSNDDYRTFSQDQVDSLPRGDYSCSIGDFFHPTKPNGKKINQNDEEINLKRLVSLLHNDVFQWVPTSFGLSFNEMGKKYCRKWKDMKEEYIGIRLNSLYIPDINEAYYPQLYKLIVKLLETKIISMYAKSVSKVNFFETQHTGIVDPDMEYKKCLYEWCNNNKELNIIIKCEQYNYNPTFNSSVFDEGISKNFHIVGTEFEKISHVCVVYLDIDDAINGGNLCLGDDYKKLKFQTNKGDIVLFPNMLHKIDNISIWSPRPLNVKHRKTKTLNHDYKRRILTLWFCDTEKGCPQFKNTPAFDKMRGGDSVADDDLDGQYAQKKDIVNLLSKRPELFYLVNNTPVLTAKDILPLDVRHHDDILIKITELIESAIDTGFCLSSNVPKEIVQIIINYAIETHGPFLRDSNDMQSNANQLRAFRRNWTLFYDAYKWRQTHNYYVS